MRHATPHPGDRVVAQINQILNRLLHPGRLGTLGQEVSRDVQACLADVERLREGTTPEAVKEALATRLHQRLGDLAETLAAQDDPADTLDRVRSNWQRGLTEPRHLGTITVTDWPDSTRPIEIDELNAVPFALGGFERLMREPNRKQQRRIATSLKALIDVLVPPLAGPRPGHDASAADAGGLLDPQSVRDVYRDLHALVTEAKQDGTLPEDVWEAGFDFASEPSEIAWRLIARRVGYSAESGWRTVRAASR